MGRLVSTGDYGHIRLEFEQDASGLVVTGPEVEAAFETLNEWLRRAQRKEELAQSVDAAERQAQYQRERHQEQIKELARQEARAPSEFGHGPADTGEDAKKRRVQRERELLGQAQLAEQAAVEALRASNAKKAEDDADPW